MLLLLFLHITRKPEKEKILDLWRISRGGEKKFGVRFGKYRNSEIRFLQ